MLNRQTDNIANGVRLLVAMGAFASVPTPKSGLAVYDAIRKVAARPPKSLASLADDLTRNARTVFDAYPDAPRDAGKLYVQMVDQGLLTPAEITDADMNPAACTAAMQAKLTDREHTGGAMPGLFAAITKPALARLLAKKEYAADLTPAFMAEVLETTHRSADGVDLANIKLDNVSAKLDNLGAQNRDTLDALALRFGEPAPEARSLPDLKAFLIEKAKDYRALRQEVVALRGTTPRIDNVLSAVEAAIESLDLAEADRLLASVRETTAETLRKPLEDNAKVMEAQARVALLRNDPETAYALFSAAADSFAGLDQDEAIRRRLDYAGSMAAFGERFGGPATAEAEAMARAALNRLTEGRPEWGDAQNLIGFALLLRGKHARNAEARELLAAAAEAYGEARKARTGALRAASADNLANTRLEQAKRTEGEERWRLLNEAVSLSSEAIEGLEEPHAVAMAFNNRGNILQMAAETTDHEASKLFMLENAFVAFDFATRAFGALKDIHNMAAARFGVAVTLALQADATSNPRLRARAIQDLQKAVWYFYENNLPQDEAMAALALGDALLHQVVEVPEQAQPFLEEAEQVFATSAKYYADVRQPRAAATALLKLACTHEVAAAFAFEKDPRHRLEAAQAALARAAQILQIDAGGEDVLSVGEAMERVRTKLAAMG